MYHVQHVSTKFNRVILFQYHVQHVSTKSKGGGTLWLFQHHAQHVSTKSKGVEIYDVFLYHVQHVSTKSKGVVVYDFFITMSNMSYLYLQDSKENGSLLIYLLLHFMDWIFFVKIKIISKKMYLRNKNVSYRIKNKKKIHVRNWRNSVI